MIQNSYQNMLKLPELKRKILITLALLFVYRVGVHVPTPGIDGAALESFRIGVRHFILHVQYVLRWSAAAAFYFCPGYYALY